MFGWLFSFIFLVIGAVNGGDLNAALIAGLFAIAGSIANAGTNISSAFKKLKEKKD